MNFECSEETLEQVSSYHHLWVVMIPWRGPQKLYTEYLISSQGLDNPRPSTLNPKRVWGLGILTICKGGKQHRGGRVRV